MFNLDHSLGKYSRQIDDIFLFFSPRLKMLLHLMQIVSIGEVDFGTFP